MSDNSTKNNSLSFGDPGDFEQFMELLKTKDRKSFDYIRARADSPTANAVFDAGVVSNAWFYNKSKEEREELEELAEWLHRAPTIRALYILQDAAEKAAETIAGLIQNPNDWLKLQACQDVLNRTVQRPADKKKPADKDRSALGDLLVQALDKVYGEEKPDEVSSEAAGQGNPAG